MMPWKWLTRGYAMYRGYTLIYQSYNDQGQILLGTEDPQVAAELGFGKKADEHFFGWVSKGDIDHWIDETWFGEVDGRRVLIEAEDGDQFSISTGSALVAERFKLNRTDKHEWGGMVPKSLLANVSCHRRTWKPT